MADVTIFITEKKSEAITMDTLPYIMVTSFCFRNHSEKNLKYGNIGQSFLLQNMVQANLFRTTTQNDDDLEEEDELDEVFPEWACLQLVYEVQLLFCILVHT